ncbi:DUF6515 family protein [Mucilaginibacter rubeus]|nr:DUF6515 family protein [Mucilaginibacter rubeus]QTE57575.1 hypothetical protein J3L23_02885 [Mucilaginibacter rubeus]QTF61722.1 hypothetical protein J3L20_30600 [Mucilaginibacter rubeus]
MNKFLIGLSIAGSLVLGLTAPADAQRGGRMTAFNRTAFHLRPDAMAVHAGFYHPYVYPRIGVVVHSLPGGYYSFFWNTYPYYYYDGLFYQSYADGSYKVAAPPIGAEVPSLPIGAEILTIDGNPYWVYKGIYYDSVIHPGGQFAYKVVGKDGILNTTAEPDPSLPLVGDMTNRLPDGAHQVRLSGKTYWVTPDEIYLEEVRKDDKLSYRVVSVPERKKEEPAPEKG